MHEKDEPLVLVIELAKSVFRLREFLQLTGKENISSYIELESYRELKLLKEIKDTHISMMRTKRQI
jgi:hypothetical protein